MHYRTILLVTFATAVAGHAALAEPDWARVDQALGRLGPVQGAGIHRYALPRTDLAVTNDGVKLRAALALTNSKR